MPALMGIVADKSHFQIKMLNSAKGPAVQSLRAQGDKIAYPQEMLKTLLVVVFNRRPCTAFANITHAA